MRAHWHKITAGWYKADYKGTELQVVSHSHFGGDPRVWNVLIDEDCAMVGYSKREAQTLAETDVDIKTAN